MSTYRVPNKCKTCEKIDTKLRRRATELAKIQRWELEGGRFSASIDKAIDMIKGLEMEIRNLHAERSRRAIAFGG
ncbi:MAG: hypothetical protein M1816_007494 [Peltula sp. TS41687]|nr:MAG: hypothetical protein M1816_007494 [Peltula sp. TS41687]